MPDGQIAHTPGSQAPKKSKQLSVKVVRNIEDIMRITAIRAAVYMAEQNCPYEEEFDGNDFCATHLIGYVDNEPVACLRMRYFGGFAKMERLAVRHEFRKTRIAFKVIREGIKHCNRKGFTKIYGHARDELIPLWGMFGFKVYEGSRQLVFSEYSYTEMVCENELPENAITLEASPYQLIRPEGDWDRPGILEESAVRDLQTSQDNYSVAAE
jgi:predicted GNAT family N-acyltransferase